MLPIFVGTASELEMDLPEFSIEELLEEQEKRDKEKNEENKGDST